MNKKTLKSKHPGDKANGVKIKEVYNENFLYEITKLSHYIEIYNFIAMDTEFPGFIHYPTNNTREQYYRSIKNNVDNLKLIQVGITICDEFGNFPDEASTWQFNLKFDMNVEKYSQESIDLLTHSGINFKKLATHGIDCGHFGEYLMTSGLLFNDELKWISFHGIYDFAYLLKVLTGLSLPEQESVFLDCLKVYFPHYYDIRHLVRFSENFKGSLSRLGQELKLNRTGVQHQAGSDSILTSDIFFKLKSDYFSDEYMLGERNVLFSMAIDESSDRNPVALSNNCNYSNYQNQVNHTQFNNQNFPSYFPSEYGQVYTNQNVFTGLQYNYVPKVNQGYIPGLKHNLNSYQFNYTSNLNNVNANFMKNGKSSEDLKDDLDK